MKNHGVFAIGQSAKESLKAAVTCEGNFKVTFLAEQLGGGVSIDSAHIDSLFRRNQNVYGQE